MRSALEGGNFLAIARSANEATPTVPNGTSGRVLPHQHRFGALRHHVAETSWNSRSPRTSTAARPARTDRWSSRFFAAATTAGLPPTINGVAGSVPGDPTVLAQIRKTPSLFYFNMHTATFPAGVVRGQLFRIG